MGKYEANFQNAGEPLTRGREGSLPQVDVVILASESLRRKSAVEHVLQREVLTLPGGFEDPRGDTMSTTKGKIDHAILLASRSDDFARGDKVAVLAADVLSRPSGENKRSISVTKRRGKPNDASQIQETFREMTQMNLDYGTLPFYLLEASSGIKFVPGDRSTDIFKPSSSTVSLDPLVISYLSTNEGIAHYVEEFEAFHKSDIYLNLGKHNPVSVTDAAGGLSGPVLMKMGAIAAIDFITPGHPDFGQHYKNYLWNSFVGIDAVVLRALEPQADQRRMDWPFLNQVAQSTMAAQGLKI